MIAGLKKFAAVAFLCVVLAAVVCAQQPAPADATAQLPQAPAPQTQVTNPFYAPPKHPNESRFFIHLAEDQRDIWTSPFHLNAGDAKWLTPVAGITAGLLATDPQSSYAMRGNHLNALRLGSDAGVAAAAGMTGAAYFWGRITHNDHARETGVLATEAMINAIGVDYAISFATGRERPAASGYQNVFFHPGNTSFPSDHAGVIWAFSSVVAQEYPSKWVQFGAYGLATGVSLARAAGNQHFLSDAFVGSVIGYQIGRHVYHEHHDRSLDDDLRIVAEQTSAPNPGTLGSTYVALDSWVYPAMERLAARGYINTAFLGIRPWTRLTCGRMLVELNDNTENHTDLPREIVQLKQSLDAEFADELAALDGRPVESLQLNSIYTRVTGIAGRPLNDNHFGQTIINDEGRPYQEGVNEDTGFVASANDGRFAFYVNGEYQHSPSAPAYPLSVRQVIANVDMDPLQPATPFDTVNRFRLLDTYSSVKWMGLDFSIGKQSLWWGPTESGAMLMSDNAEPFWMVRIDRAEPLYVPLLSKFLGPLRFDNFFGKLSGHTLYPAEPFIFGQKISFKPTENLEVGFTRDDIMAGEGHVPLTIGSFWNSFTSFTDVSVETKFSRNDPGARHATFDFSYRVPFLRRWLTLYTDSLVHDEPSPLSAPRRAAVNPGIYLTHLPGLPKLDFRAEAVYTNLVTNASFAGEFIYFETIYHNLYLNNGNLMGNWIGREGNGYQAWSTYSFSARSSLQAAFRYAKIAPDYIPGGSTQYDANLSGVFRVRPNVELKTFLQYESWLVPVLEPTRQRDFTTSVQLTWWPGVGWKRATPH